jgi:predicted Zn-dependent protease
MIEMARKRPRIAAERFRDAERLDPGLARGYALEARALLAAGDRPGAAAALKRGLAVSPRDSEIGSLLEQLGPH